MPKVGMFVGMKLKQYLKEADLTHKAFGERIGATEHAVKKWARGERVPRPEHMASIFSATGGIVTANDFFASEEQGSAA